MPKVKPPSQRAVDAARRVMAAAPASICGSDGPIDIEALAASCGVMALYSPISTSRGVLLRAGERAIVHIDERARRRPWGRFTLAHEFAHFLLHALVDHFEQCTMADAPRTDAARGFEREANECGAEFLIPEERGIPFCSGERACIEDVDRLARTFRTSFEMSAIRFVELTMAPCAVVVSKAGQVQWALESLTFPGTIASWRALHPQSMAAQLPGRVGSDREREVPGVAWKSKRPLVERAWRTRGERTLSWIVAA